MFHITKGMETQHLCLWLLIQSSQGDKATILDLLEDPWSNLQQLVDLEAKHNEVRIIFVSELWLSNIDSVSILILVV